MELPVPCDSRHPNPATHKINSPKPCGPPHMSRLIIQQSSVCTPQLCTRRGRHTLHTLIVSTPQTSCKKHADSTPQDSEDTRLQSHSWCCHSTHRFLRAQPHSPLSDAQHCARIGTHQNTPSLPPSLPASLTTGHTQVTPRSTQHSPAHTPQSVPLAQTRAACLPLAVHVQTAGHPAGPHNHACLT